MALTTISLPFNGTENVNRTGDPNNGPITPLASMVDLSNNLMFQTGTEGMVKAADGNLATVGSQADAAWIGGGASGTLVSILKAIYNAIIGTLKVTDATVASVLSGTLQTHAVPPGAVYAGGPIAAPSGGGTLPSQSCSSVTVYNDPSSTGTLFVGNSTSQTVPLAPGQWASVDVNNMNLVGVKGASGVSYDYLAVA